MALSRLVLLPGLDGTGILFQPFLEAWDGATEVLDLPPDPALGYAELLPLLRRRLPAGEPYVLLAESFSGPLGIRIAAEPPEGLRGLILCATFARSPLGRTGRLLRWLVKPALLRQVPLALSRRWLLGRRKEPEIQALLREALARTPAELLAARIRQVLEVDATDALRGCRLPILVLSAAADAVVLPRSLKHFRRLVPQAAWREFPGPHLLLQTRPRDAAACILEFLRKIQ